MGQALTKKNKSRKIRHKTKRRFESKEIYFIKNGAILLEKEIAVSQGQKIGTEQLKIFSNEDIEKATNNYDPDLLMRTTHDVATYKGIVENHDVAVMVPKLLEPDPNMIDLILTGVSIRLVTCHEYMLKVYGCCLETYIPLLVCEFYSNGTLFEHIHGDNIVCSKRMEWGDCLRVVTEIAYALSYMHNVLSRPVVHRDVHSSGICIDSQFRGKLSKFGLAVAINPRDLSRKWSVQGTMGYIDPEYMETRKVTDKCDVYSFGVLLLEMLTRRQPTAMARDGKDLVDLFVTAVEMNCMMEMIDCEVLRQGSKDEIAQVAELALTCVAEKGAERPTMIAVVNELWNIQCRGRK